MFIKFWISVSIKCESTVEIEGMYPHDWILDTFPHPQPHTYTTPTDAPNKQNWSGDPAGSNANPCANHMSVQFGLDLLGWNIVEVGQVGVAGSLKRVSCKVPGVNSRRRSA